jgi:predicted enzyme related to lactoylglutathione lyase
MARLLRVAPILPTADVDRMQDHYQRLGFAVRRHDDTYATASRDGIDLHFRLSPGHQSAAGGGVIYLAVDDADALHAEWLASGVGQTSELFDPGFGVWEAAHTDPDGNLIRFGSPVARTGFP